VAGVDPRRENALQVLKTSINDFGMRGLKLLPPSGFYPNDSCCYPLYEFICECGFPVIIHTGPEAPPFYSKYGYPILSDDVASDFPDLKIILAHAGFCWWPEALNIASTKPNVFLDLAGWQPKTQRHPVEEFYRPLRIMIDTIGPGRILFGSDWPALRLFKGGQGNWIKSFKEPPLSVQEAGITFSEEEIDAILGNNAAKIFRE
jgi:predicted TIM-barrel fold metal-dependent hydrolase